MTDDKVIILDCETTLDLPVERVLKAAVEDAEQFEHAIVVTEEANGNITLRTTTSSAAKIILMLEVAKQKTLKVIEEG